MDSPPLAVSICGMIFLYAAAWLRTDVVKELKDHAITASCIEDVI